uniref:Zinc finger protein 39 n=2 Tax=Cavia porcellus TaxID=10141 RepID=A0A286Y2P9_CAVPO
MGLVSFDDVSVDFTWEEWKDLSDAQRNLYKEVMLETYSNLVALGHCSIKPDVIFKLEQGSGPCVLGEALRQCLPDVQKLTSHIQTAHENQEKHFWQVITTSSEEKVEMGKPFNVNSNYISVLNVKNRNYAKVKPEELNIWQSVFLPDDPHEMQTGEEPFDLTVTGNSFRLPEDLNLQNKVQSVQKHFQYCGQGKPLNMKAVLTHKRIHVGEAFNKFNEYGKDFEKVALISEEMTQVREKSVEYNVCHAALYKRAKLINCEKIQKGQKYYECSDLGESFISKLYVEKYQRTHEEEETYRCNEHERFFCQKTHHRINREAKLYEDYECGKNFNQKQNFSRRQKSHTNEKPYECNMCEKAFYRKSHLNRHQRIHTGEKPYECEECRKTFYHKSSLIIHQRTHTGEKPYDCTKCKKAFYCKSDLTIHQRTHTGEKPYECEECRKTFYSKSHLTIHQGIHTGGKPYACEECRKTFNRKSNLTVHKRTHTGEKPYACNICGKSFYRKSHLSTHQGTHRGEKPYECKECKKTFNHKAALTVHQGTHTGNKPYACGECKKTFLHKSSLTVHQRSHTGNKPFACEECSKAFYCKSHLTVHQRTHTGEKPYECQECEKSFHQKSYLSRHLLTHETEKRFECKQCGKTFYHKASLIIHQRTHTGE